MDTQPAHGSLGTALAVKQACMETGLFNVLLIREEGRGMSKGKTPVRTGI